MLPTWPDGPVFIHSFIRSRFAITAAASPGSNYVTLDGESPFPGHHLAGRHAGNRLTTDASRQKITISVFYWITHC